MSNLTNKKQKEQLDLQSNTEDNHNKHSETGYERTQIPNSPFWIIGEPEKGYAVVMADFQITNMMKTKEELLKAIEENHWEIIYRMIGIVAQKLIEEEKQAQIKKFQESLRLPAEQLHNSL